MRRPGRKPSSAKVAKKDQSDHSEEDNNNNNNFTNKNRNGVKKAMRKKPSAAAGSPADIHDTDTEANGDDDLPLGLLSGRASLKQDVPDLPDIRPKMSPDRNAESTQRLSLKRGRKRGTY